jgi:hypothetical protein
VEGFESEGCHGCYLVHAIEDIDETGFFSNFRALFGQTIDIERAAASHKRVNWVALKVTSKPWSTTSPISVLHLHESFAPRRHSRPVAES